jgi:tetratricopeptide (TPR) repeat protein
MNRLGAVVLAIIAAATPHARQAALDDWRVVTARLDRAAANGSSVALKEVRSDLLRVLALPSSPDCQPIVQYAIAYTAWRLAFMSGVPARERDDMLDDAVVRLRGILSVNQNDAEALALLGGVYATQIGRSSLKGMVLGGRVSAALDRAAELNPASPRVALQQGISAFHTPALFGGGADKAERLLRRSLGLFSHEPADRPWPNWGRLDAHAWLGQVLARTGDRAGARAEYAKALTLAPESAWIRQVLVPALERGAER